MKRLPSSRILIAIVLMVLFLIFIVALLFITNLSFSVWEQLQQKPEWVIWTYAVAIVLISFVFGRIVWRLLIPGKKRPLKKPKSQTSHNIEATAQRLDELSQKISVKELHSSTFNKEAQSSAKNSTGAESSLVESSVDSFSAEKATDFKLSPELLSIHAELQDYAQRKSEQIFYIALFGDISSGKSSVIKALIAHDTQPANAQQQTSQQQSIDAYNIEIGVMGGTTREVVHYHWDFENNGVAWHAVLTDMPGLNEQFSELDLLATEEVRRAHIAIYLCDGDLTASQFNELKRILLLKKPCIIAVNKSDRYSAEELQLIIDRIKQRVQPIAPDTSILTISAGGMRDFIRLTPDGDEERVQRPIQPEVKCLQEQLLKIMKTIGIDQLEQLRELSVSSMVNNKLDDVEARFKHSQSQRLVSSYTKKAVVASMATISPGTDLIVQGYLGIQMIKDLCKLYDVSATDIDANKLIELIQSRMDKTLPLLLAIAGNGLKAFPGIGTVSGGLMHAVAYGMIFDTLGHSLARTLEVTGELSPTLVSDLYKEQLGENIESRTKDFIKLVLKLRNSDR